jgi:hypothetical protein
MRFSGGVNPSDDASALSSNGSAMMIRNGRFGIDIADLGASILADGPSAPIPNDTFAADGKNFTVITGINGTVIKGWLLLTLVNFSETTPS